MNMNRHCRIIKCILSGVVCALLLPVSMQAQKNTAFIPGQVWNDTDGNPINAHGGGLLYHNGTYYWYGEYKKGKTILPDWATWECYRTDVTGVGCYSSKDLLNWKFEGIVLPAVKEDPNHDLHPSKVLERPKVIYNKKNDQYVMWFHLEPRGAGYSGALSGVAVSKNVVGPYSFVNAFRPNAGFWPVNVQELHKQPCTLSADLRFSGGELPAHPDSLNLLGRDQISGQMARDMNLFVDDDGIAYHIYSSEENSTLHISQLTDDYTSYSGKYARFFPGRFMEAPALFKQKGKYYLIMSGCTGWAPNAGRSAVASSIWGPWKELENPFRGENSEVSFYSQSTYVLPVPGHADRFIYMGDRWTPENAIDGRYIWLPIRFEGEQPVIEWQSEWSY